ncbi:hypothetical protein BSFP_037290 [Burkholderia stabilis]|uniref:Uncharacterized protein n=1 Tax=Burkholderia stabilis TaxID=95485 RepID=A0A1Y1BLU2_9BURK|nr:hypothetical protein BSFP_037290 [Burkholderia stabilis]
MPPVAVFAVPVVAAPEPSATEPATFALAPEPNACAFDALDTAALPIAMPPAVVTVLLLPNATEP